MFNLFASFTDCDVILGSTPFLVKYHLGAFTNLILYYEALRKVCVSVSFIYHSLIIHPTFNNDDWDITNWWRSAVHVRAQSYKYPQLSIRTAAVVVTFLMNQTIKLHSASYCLVSKQVLKFLHLFMYICWSGKWSSFATTVRFINQNQVYRPLKNQTKRICALFSFTVGTNRFSHKSKQFDASGPWSVSPPAFQTWQPAISNQLNCPISHSHCLSGLH